MDRIKRLVFAGIFRCATTCAAAGILFISCSEDPAIGSEHRGDIMRFEVAETNGWNVQSSVKHSAAPSGEGAASEVFALRGAASADTLFLHASVSEGIGETHIVRSELDTRAAPIDGIGAFYDEFGVLTYVYTGSWSESLLPDYMYNVEVTKESGWSTEYFWPGGSYKVKFFAYAPYKGQGIALSDKTSAGTPTIAYTVPAAVAEQKDLLAAVSDEMSGSTDKAAPLTFYHALTAVRFVTGDAMLAGHIKKITLKNVSGSGTHTIGRVAAAWEVDNRQPADFACEPDMTADGSAGQEITSDAATFMMIPQILPEEARIEVEYTDDLTDTPRILTASIAGSEWPQGKTVTYRISTTSIKITPTFTVTAPAAFTYEGGTRVYKVDSRGIVSREGDPEKSVPLKWKAEFVSETAPGEYEVIDKPDWLTAFETSGNGGTEAQSYDATVTAQTKSEDSDPHNTALQNAPSVNATSGYTPYNLSNPAGAPEVLYTANCYVINAPGEYTLPLVYGNAIDATKVPDAPHHNTSAYSTDNRGVNILQTLVNHLGNSIASPYVYEHGTPKDALLVWQDSPDLVTDVELEGNSLKFRVGQDFIKQGNAVVAVLDDSDRIMWSWHIWVTDYKLGDDLKTIEKSSRSYKMLPVNLGWCDGESLSSYAGRSVKVRFTQEETNKTEIITITQAPYSVSTAGNAPYYQWGRKDPMLPSTGKNQNKTWYAEDKTSSSDLKTERWATSQEAIVNGILNPGTFCSNNYMDKKYYNLWNIDNTGVEKVLTSSVKTVYDPCPVGYKIPVNYVFQLLTESNPVWNTSGCDIDCTEGSVFYPASGLRNASTGVITTGTDGTTCCYWSANAASAGVSYQLYIFYRNSMTVKPSKAEVCAMGCSVRPVQE